MITIYKFEEESYEWSLLPVRLNIDRTLTAAVLTCQQACSHVSTNNLQLILFLLQSNLVIRNEMRKIGIVFFYQALKVRTEV